MVSGVLDIVDDVPVEEADALQCPSPQSSYRVLLAFHAQRNLDRNICRGPVERVPVQRFKS